MKQHGLAGSIINISSVNATDYLHPNRAGYCASKAAIIQMTKALVGELGDAGIRINCILPGLFHTPATDYKLQTEEQRAEITRLIPLHFIAKPSDLDGTILYLASNKASPYVTGSIITVDGGISWGGARWRNNKIMFVVLLTYKKSLEEIEKHLSEHRAFLDQGYGKDFFLASGPMNPRTGGVIISR